MKFCKAEFQSNYAISARLDQHVYHADTENSESLPKMNADKRGQNRCTDDNLEPGLTQMTLIESRQVSFTNETIGWIRICDGNRYRADNDKPLRSYV